MAKLYHCGQTLDTELSYAKLLNLPKINDIEIKGNKYSIRDLKIPGKVVSAPAGSGEIFNDYTNNVAYSYAHAEGSNTKAIGSASHSEGFGTEASGGNAHAEGYETKAPGGYAHAEGNATNASGVDSHAEGHGTKALEHSSHAEGRETTASGDASHAEGISSEASGNYSHAEGHYTKAHGNYSHAEGGYTKATMDCSHAEGNNTQATGSNSHAEGSNTIASGYAAHAEGNGTKAIGSNSHAGGLGTEAQNTAQTSIGMYNNNQTNSLFEVGNGNTSTSKSNAFEVFKDGHINVNGDYYQYGKKIDFGGGGGSHETIITEVSNNLEYIDIYYATGKPTDTLGIMTGWYPTINIYRDKAVVISVTPILYQTDGATGDVWGDAICCCALSSDKKSVIASLLNKTAFIYESLGKEITNIVFGVRVLYLKTT